MEIERDTLEMDVLLVGAGPANLSCALHLSRLIADHNERAKQSAKKALGEINIAVIEKAAEIVPLLERVLESGEKNIFSGWDREPSLME